jgi:hypothetical protein
MGVFLKFSQSDQLYYELTSKKCQAFRGVLLRSSPTIWSLNFDQTIIRTAKELVKLKKTSSKSHQFTNHEQGNTITTSPQSLYWSDWVLKCKHAKPTNEEDKFALMEWDPEKSMECMMVMMMIIWQFPTAAKQVCLSKWISLATSHSKRKNYWSESNRFYLHLVQR